jgi:glycosyltransferase involved in cell wall biosynthesis
MLFSLVLCTVDRVDELTIFLKSLTNQTLKSFELIIVDQNTDDRLNPLLLVYKDSFNIKYLKAEKGLSHARNIGIQHAQGEIIGFPDDDCWYSANILKEIADILHNNNDWDGITGRVADQYNRNSVGHMDLKGGKVDFLNVWRRGVSITIFLRAELIRKIGIFNEKLGAGAMTVWGSGEETDYLIRGIQQGANIHYVPSLIVGHPSQIQKYDDATIKRAYRYGVGMGFVFKMHHYPIWFTIYFLIIRPLGGIVISLIKLNQKGIDYYWHMLRGRYTGRFRQ